MLDYIERKRSVIGKPNTYCNWKGNDQSITNDYSGRWWLFSSNNVGFLVAFEKRYMAYKMNLDKWW